MRSWLEATRSSKKDQQLMPLAIEVRGLCFDYASKRVLSDVNLSVPEGSIYGFLGPNGAGKTTLIRLLLGLLSPSQGHISVNGALPKRGRGPDSVGAMIETPSLYPNLTAQENLSVTQLTLGQRRSDVANLLRTVGLQGGEEKKVAAFSLGMKQRLAIALALLADPRVLILDEPVNGLDPEGIDEVRHLLKHLSRERGITVFLSSHILSDVERVATHVGILRDGRIAFEGPLADTRVGQLEIECRDVPLAGAVLTDMGLPHQAVGQDRLVVEGAHDSSEVIRRLVLAGVAVMSASKQHNSLEDFYREARR